MNYRNAPKLINENKPSNAGQDATQAFAYAAREQSAPAQRMFTVQSMQKNEFNPSAKWMEDMSNVPVNKQSQYRKELIDKGFIQFYKMPTGANVIVLHWESIMHKAYKLLKKNTQEDSSKDKDIPLLGVYNLSTKVSREYTIKHYARQYGLSTPNRTEIMRCRLF